VHRRPAWWVVVAGRFCDGSPHHMWLASRLANAGSASAKLLLKTLEVATADQPLAPNHGIHYTPQNGPTPPSSMATSNNPPGPTIYAYDAARSHGTPAPPSFARQMPPPSSPQQQYPSQPQRAYGPPYAPHRPGSSMSISSLIGGGDTGAHAQTSQSQTSPPTNRNMYGSNTSRAPEGQVFAAGSPTRPYSNHASPELGRQSLPPASQPYKLFGQRLYAPATQDARQPPGSIPPRPNSQPLGPVAGSDEGRSLYDALAGRPSGYGAPEERRRTLGESHHSRPNAAELLATASLGAANRDRPNTVHPVSQSSFSPPRTQHTLAGPSEPPRSLWRQTAPSTVDNRRDELAASQRPYGLYPAPAHAAPRYEGQTTEEMIRQRSGDRLNNRVMEQYHAPPTSDPASMDRHKTEPLARSLSGSGYPGRSMYDYPRRMGEEMQLSKSHIGFGLEASRRTGRASPLPQAVQGAQAQPLSIGKDPGIKSEFGRMFSGLGSGLGSSTPSRGSPMPQNGQGSFSHDPESGDMSRLQRVNSQQGRRAKRVKDEDVFDADGIDGRGTPSGARGGKRSKHNHPGHHHHHAPHHQ
jgi:hypothetical protein